MTNTDRVVLFLNSALLVGVMFLGAKLYQAETKPPEPPPAPQVTVNPTVLSDQSIDEIIKRANIAQADLERRIGKELQRIIDRNEAIAQPQFRKKP